MCSLPSFAEPVLSPAGADSPPLDPIRTMFEHLVASMARIEARMDDYDRQPPSSRQPARPDPEPSYNRPIPRSVEVTMPFVQPFFAVTVATRHLPATAQFMAINEGFRPNPSGASGWRRFGPTERLVQQDLQSTWDLPPASRPHSPWDNWGNRFSEPHVYNGRSSWDPPSIQPSWRYSDGPLYEHHIALYNEQQPPPPPTYEPDPSHHPHPPEHLAYFGRSSYVQRQGSAAEYHSWVHQQLPPQPVLDQPSPRQQSFSGWSSTSHCHPAAPLPADAPVSVATRQGQPEETISQSEPSVASAPQSLQNTHVDVEVVTISSKTMAVDLNFPTMNEKFKKDKVLLAYTGESNRLQFKSTDGHGEAMDHRSTMLDADARLTPPHNDRSCLNILGCDDKVLVLSLNYGTTKGSLLIFVGDNDGRRSAVRRAFDPGGDISHLAYVISDSLHCFVILTLRTRWILTERELIR